MADQPRDINDFGRSLARHLQRAKLTQRQFASRAGEKQQTLNKLCHQRSLKESRSIEVISQWGTILGLSPEEVTALHLELALMRCPAVVKTAFAEAKATVAKLSAPDRRPRRR